ncbi:ergothioneine biosynthesis protein EgtC [Streptomyces sp. 6N223]|uniref:ergothioneine biosynthesis protein EgtC n=1 Tax=Streptomyces sp. 6N223 TaxID=3457412 RepID=UPI003FD54374
MMCRHLAYLGPVRGLDRLLTEPPHGLLAQARTPRLVEPGAGAVSADGFGVGWYPPAPDAAPARYRRAVPIWGDANLPDLARTIRSRAVLAAVRCATTGTSREESAAAPFALGRWLFSHNGAVDDWRRLPADLGLRLDAEALLGVQARCDAALLWLLIGRRLTAGEPPGEALAAVVRAVAAVRPRARLTLLLTDGRSIAATRHGPSLYYRTAPGEVLVASEPTDHATDWSEVPQRCLLLATRGTATTVPLRERTPRHDVRLHHEPLQP